MHHESLLPAGKKWQLVWNDEFDGKELDTTKWDFRLHLMQQRHLTFTDKGAVLDGNSLLHLQLLEKDGQYYSSHLQTGSNFLDRPGEAYTGKFRWPVAQFRPAKFLHRYGYYEIRCRLQKQPGWWAAFWLQSPVIGSTLNPVESGVEVDIMENFTRDGIIYHNNHWDGYGKDHQSCSSGPIQLQGSPDDFHVFGLEWTPDCYRYFVDGRQTWQVNEPVSRREQFILISTECSGYRDGDKPSPELQKAVLPDAFVIDYVRVFDEIP